ncbi:GNAT family N-acetyltransferase [Pseudokineococcus sp. 1T1Z-3]|uniref:GNAT family N-acetyltransferase n=1 Tax=Pseudokineococcus sp. 1T1Z-3 TaxID=3132745 RepID=UPI003095ACFF
MERAGRGTLRVLRLPRRRRPGDGRPPAQPAGPRAVRTAPRPARGRGAWTWTTPSGPSVPLRARPGTPLAGAARRTRRTESDSREVESRSSQQTTACRRPDGRSSTAPTLARGSPTTDPPPEQPGGHAAQADALVWPSAPELETARLLLEPLRVEHADEADVAFADPALHRHTGGHPATSDEVRARYTGQVVGHSPDGQHGWLNWMLREHRTTRLVGTVQATTGQAPDGTRSAELGWVIATSHQGQHLAAEAGAAVASWLLHRGFTVLVAHVHPDNVASAVTAYRLGMTPTPGLLDGEVEWRGRLHLPAG